MPEPGALREWDDLELAIALQSSPAERAVSQEAGLAPSANWARMAPDQV
jgi:hypothetical protein